MLYNSNAISDVSRLFQNKVPACLSRKKWKGSNCFLRVLPLKEVWHVMEFAFEKIQEEIMLVGMISLFLLTAEDDILKWCVKPDYAATPMNFRGCEFIKGNECVQAFDGFMSDINLVDEGDVPQILFDMQVHVKEETGFDIKWDTKPFDQPTTLFLLYISCRTKLHQKLNIVPEHNLGKQTQPLHLTLTMPFLLNISCRLEPHQKLNIVPRHILGRPKKRLHQQRPTLFRPNISCRTTHRQRWHIVPRRNLDRRKRPSHQVRATLFTHWRRQYLFCMTFATQCYAM